MTNLLLTRDEFRESCLKRDNYRCVICGNDKDIVVHHIIERRLFTAVHEFGGYFNLNGASLCESCHIKAEETTLSCDQIRYRIGTDKVILPDHLYDEFEYDKWGNIILANGKRLKGELFYDESVQKILKQGNVLNEFSKYVKHPRIHHLPWSTLGKDDRQLKDESSFINRNVIVSLKYDGEQHTCYNDYIHARSIDSGSHESRDWVKGLWSRFSYLLDDNMRICGENMYAVHSIKYEDLESYFYMFSMWIDNRCLSWQETIEYSKILGLHTVPVIYEGIYNKQAIINSFKPFEEKHEGYVIRLVDEFTYMDFKKSVAKFVKPSFRQTVNQSHGHWISKKVEPNGLKL